MTTNELLAALARGEAAAFEEVCARYGERLGRIARRKLAGPMRARMETADVVQTTLGELVRSADTVHFDSEAAFLRWIGTVLERKILAAARRWNAAKRDRHREAPLPAEDMLHDDSARSPSQIFSHKESRHSLNTAVAALPTKDREVVIARIFLDLPWPHVAKALGTTVEAAQMRFTRVKARLKEVLDPDA